MKPRWLWIMVAVGIILIIGSFSWIIFIMAFTPSLYGVRWPLIYLIVLGASLGVGLVGAGSGVAYGILSTKSRIKKKIEHHKTLEILKKMRAI